MNALPEMPDGSVPVTALAQPRYRLWRDAPDWWKEGVALCVAFGAFCIAGGGGAHLLMRRAPWQLAHQWKTPLYDLWPYLVMLGLVVAVATPTWFCVAAAIRRDALTGSRTGVVKLGWDLQSRYCDVTHIRRGHHKYACRCELMHSDEEALTTGWRYSGETRSREGVGWGGLASLFRHNEERAT